MSLDVSLGWSLGDDIRVLVASGLPVGVYQIQQIQRDMNDLGLRVPSIISPVIDLLDEFDAAQAALKALNESSEGKVLIKADVVEWEAQGAGSSYGPEREIQRIRGLLYQYFASSVLFSSGHLGSSGNTGLIRS